MSCKGYLQVNAGDPSEWDVILETGRVLARGLFPRKVDVENENFDFDGVTVEVSEMCGLELVNNQLWTASSPTRVYWSVDVVGVDCED